MKTKLFPVACTFCGRNVYWVYTVNEKRIPVDAVPDLAGNIVFINERAHVLSSDDVKAGKHADLTHWMPHFATCPNYKRKG